MWLRTPLVFLTELLAAIPSIVYGLWGIFRARAGGAKSSDLDARLDACAAALQRSAGRRQT